MVERKTPIAKPRAATAFKAVPSKEPAGRFYDLQKEVKAPTPYVLTEDITILPLTRRQFVELGQANDDEDAQNRVVLGDNYDAVIALFNDQPLAVWNAFTTDINRHLFGSGVEEAPGKSEESSDS